MHQLIASFLFQNKCCPLPGVGTLRIKPTAAQADFYNKSIMAPAGQVVFESKETDADKLLDYIASQTNTTILQAIDALSQFGNNLKNGIFAGRHPELDGIGRFSADDSGGIVFEPAVLPVVYSPSVKADRVIHPEAEHTILVGDKETTNTVMTEYFNEETVAKKDSWWIWAIVLAVIAITVMFIYFSNSFFVSRLGNAAAIN
jgi:hypothetical protein